VCRSLPARVASTVGGSRLRLYSAASRSGPGLCAKGSGRSRNVITQILTEIDGATALFTKPSSDPPFYKTITTS
jgi:hypothetical protein